MQNNLQSPESVILGVDTHLDIHVGAIIRICLRLWGQSTLLLMHTILVSRQP